MTCGLLKLLTQAPLFVGVMFPLENLLAAHLETTVTSGADARSVMRRMRLRFPQQTSLAERHGNVTLAVDTFELVKAMPATETAKKMAADGFVTVATLFPDSNVLVGYHSGVKKLIKPLQPKEAQRVHAFMAARGDKMNEHVVPFELRWEDPVKGKSFMVMPELPALLEQIPASQVDARSLLDHMSSALEYLHGLGFAHCDVKPGNICAQYPLSFVLVDLGSIALFGARTDSTPAYVPRDVRGDRSSAELDWCMLGMTLAEKGCRDDHALDGGAAPRSVTRGELLAHLKAHLPAAVWEGYSCAIGPL
jgi:serine/threonine protein kinase